MVQNIRPPQDSHFALHQSDSAAKPIRNGGNSVDADLKTPVPAPTPIKEQVEQAAVRVKDVLRGTTTHLEIEIDHDLGKVVIKILNGDSGEIIRQIPSQELLDLAKQLGNPKGLLIRERA